MVRKTQPQLSGLELSAREVDNKQLQNHVLGAKMEEAESLGRGKFPGLGTKKASRRK